MERTGRAFQGPILNYNSGHPFNLLSGEPTNGDNHPTNGRPIGAPRNSGLGRIMRIDAAAELASQSGGEKHAVDTRRRIQQFAKSDQLCQREQSGGAAVRDLWSSTDGYVHRRLWRAVRRRSTCVGSRLDLEMEAGEFEHALRLPRIFRSARFSSGCGSASVWWVDLKKVRG